MNLTWRQTYPRDPKVGDVWRVSIDGATDIDVRVAAVVPLPPNELDWERGWRVWTEDFDAHPQQSIRLSPEALPSMVVHDVGLVRDGETLTIAL